MSKSEIQSKAQRLDDGEPKGNPRFIYGDDGEFDVVAVCPKDIPPDHCMPLAYPTARSWPDGTVKRIPWTEDRLRDALQMTFRKIRAVYGGEWILSIWRTTRLTTPQDRVTGARAEAERRILAGPDTPGKRWLQRHQGQTPAPALAESLSAPAGPARGVPVATRDMIDRLRDLPPRPEPAQPLRATPAWFDEESAQLAAEEAEERAAMQQEGSRI